MALPYYVEPEYWVEGYAEGDAKLGQVLVSCATTTAVDGQRVATSAALIQAAATATASGQVVYLGAATLSAAMTLAASALRVRQSAAAVGGAATATISGAVTAAGAVSVFGRTNITIDPQKIKTPLQITVSITSSASVSAREKWEVDPDTAETWTPQYGGSGELYVLPGYWEDGYALLWYPAPDTPETWARLN